MIRIALAGFGTESSVFSKHVMTAAEFRIHRGAELIEQLEIPQRLSTETGDVTWVPTLSARAPAGGLLVRSDFELFADEIVDRLRRAENEAPLDGLFLDLHGAARVQGMDRAEETLLHRIRAVVGDDLPISLAMDTHGNFSQELAELVDLAVCFRTAPHMDRLEIKERALRNLLEVVRSGRTPLKAYVRVPVLLAGEHTSTFVEPGASVFGGLIPAIERYGVVDASLWVGYFWSDEPRNAAAVLVTGYDGDAVVACAAEVARSYWDARREFRLTSEHAGSWDEALEFILTRPTAPCFVSDAGDNITGGGSGDTTFALQQTLARADVIGSGIRILFAGIFDPDSVDAAERAGVAGILDRGIGAHLDDRFGAPVQGPWKVASLVQGLYEGEGVTGAVLTHPTGVEVTVQRGRAYFTNPDDPAFTHRHLANHAYVPVDGYDVVVVKVGYLFPGQLAEAGSAFMAVTPGGTDLDLGRLHYERTWRPIFPLDDDFEVDLEPVLLNR
jgi:microcystin degradation protein MlrC